MVMLKPFPDLEAAPSSDPLTRCHEGIESYLFALQLQAGGCGQRDASSWRWWPR